MKAVGQPAAMAQFLPHLRTEQAPCVYSSVDTRLDSSKSLGLFINLEVSEKDPGNFKTGEEISHIAVRSEKRKKRGN